MVNLDYTGEYAAGFAASALSTLEKQAVVRLTDDTGAAYFDDGAGRVARLRLDAVVRRCTAAGATVEVFVHDLNGVQQGEALISRGCTSSFRNEACSLALPALTGMPPYYLGIRVTGNGQGVYDGFFRLVPFGAWGWEGVTLSTEEAMRAVEDDLFNDSVFANGGDYTNELRRAKADIRLRLLEAEIEPDAVWTDGVSAAPGDESPSGVGTQVIPGLILPATYAAVAHAYSRVAGYNDGRLSDKVVQYRAAYDDAMRGAIGALLAINENGDSLMSRDETRERRPRRAVL